MQDLISQKKPCWCHQQNQIKLFISFYLCHTKTPRISRKSCHLPRYPSKHLSGCLMRNISTPLNIGTSPPLLVWKFDSTKLSKVLHRNGEFPNALNKGTATFIHDIEITTVLVYWCTWGNVQNPCIKHQAFAENPQVLNPGLLTDNEVDITLKTVIYSDDTKKHL
jgi:hypothetical protein